MFINLIFSYRKHKNFSVDMEIKDFEVKEGTNEIIKIRRKLRENDENYVKKLNYWELEHSIGGRFFFLFTYLSKYSKGEKHYS